MQPNNTAHLRPLKDFKQTVNAIFTLAGFTGDLRPYGFENIFQLYNHVRDLPYVADPVGLETVSRPGYTLAGDWNGPRDCDDKTTIMIAGAKHFGIPARAVVCGEIPQPHHVYPELLISGRWMPFDATYGDEEHDCRLGKRLYHEAFRQELYG